MFQRVRQKLNIRQVVEYYGVKLNRASKGSCPMHNEKTKGSFSVSDSKQIFKCFGCNTSGDSIAFVSKMFSISMYEAVKKLNEDFCLGITKEKPSRESRVRQARFNLERQQRAKAKAEYWAKFDLYAEYDKIMFETAPRVKFEPVNNAWIHANEMCLKLWHELEIMRFKLQSGA